MPRKCSHATLLVRKSHTRLIHPPIADIIHHPSSSSLHSVILERNSQPRSLLPPILLLPHNNLIEILNLLLT
jgi:hypothetical protein